MLKKKFHYTTVLGVIHDRIILNNEPYDLLSFLVGFSVTQSNYREARNSCLWYLQQKFSDLESIEVKLAFDQLDRIPEYDTLCIATDVENWLKTNSAIFQVYGEYIEVRKNDNKSNKTTKKTNLAFLHEELKRLKLN